MVQDFDFGYEMVSNASENKAVKREQLLTLLEKVTGLKDDSGLPVVDTRKIVDEVLKTFNLDFDAGMDEEEYVTMMKKFNEIQEKI